MTRHLLLLLRIIFQHRYAERARRKSELKTGATDAPNTTAHTDHDDGVTTKGGGGRISRTFACDGAAAFQNAAAAHLVSKSRRAIRWSRELVRNESWSGIDTLVVSGGVAANAHIRSEVNIESASQPYFRFLTLCLCAHLCLVVFSFLSFPFVVKLSAMGKELGVRVAYPPQMFCVDNGAMVAWGALEMMESGSDLRADRSFKQGVRRRRRNTNSNEEEEGEREGEGEGEFDSMQWTPRWPLGERVDIDLVAHLR